MLLWAFLYRHTEHDGLQSVGSQRVWQDWSSWAGTQTYVYPLLLERPSHPTSIHPSGLYSSFPLAIYFTHGYICFMYSRFKSPFIENECCKYVCIDCFFHSLCSVFWWSYFQCSPTYLYFPLWIFLLCHVNMSFSIPKMWTYSFLLFLRSFIIFVIHF